MSSLNVCSNLFISKFRFVKFSPFQKRKLICDLSHPWDSTSFIIARVAHKTEITSYENETSGNIFLIYLRDESGEIIATVHNELCNTFFKQIETDQVYFFADFEVNWATKKYVLMPHSFNINFTKSTKVLPIGSLNQNITAIPGIRYNLQPIEVIHKMSDGEPVDTIGICGKVDELAKRGGYYIREIELMDYDDYDGVITLNLWNDAAINFDGKEDDIILVKGARVREHNLKNKINFDWFSKMEINPNIREAKSLREWLENL